MKTKSSVLFAVALVGIALFPSRVGAQSLSGLWDATVVVNGNLDVPFRMEFSGSGSAAKGSFFNGDEKVTSTTGRFENGSLVLSFDEYGTHLEATLKDGRLEGQYSAARAGRPIRSRRNASRRRRPTMGRRRRSRGCGTCRCTSSKGESAWQFIVRQSGPEVSAAILRVDGDTGTLTGRYRDGTFVLSHFSGARPLVLEVTPGADGTLTVIQNQDREKPATATRMELAKAKGLPEPSDPSRFTSVTDPTEPFRFSFPDLDGRIVSNTDPRFQGKVVHRQHFRQLVPELPRRSAVSRRSSTRSTARRASRS